MTNKEIFMKLLLEDGNEDLNEKCLISNELLDTNYITLVCNHKFNSNSYKHPI